MEYKLDELSVLDKVLIIVMHSESNLSRATLDRLTAIASREAEEEWMKKYFNDTEIKKKMRELYGR